MAPAPPHVITNSTQAWKLIEKDYTLRLSLVAHKFAEEHQKAKMMLFAETRRRGNSGYLGPAWVDMEIADTNKRAEWAYQACCEVWEIQGRTKCRPFFRAVFDRCLQLIFAVRKGCFQSQFDLYRKRTRGTIPQSRIIGHMNRKMGQLISEWNTRLEIEARNNEYQQQQIREQEHKRTRTLSAPVSAPAPIVLRQPPETPDAHKGPPSHGETLTIDRVGGATSTFTWKELENRFLSIHADASGQRFSTHFIRTVWESGDVSEEWIVGGTPALREKFENLASISARKLGYAQSEGAHEYWLNRVREWMQQAGLDKDKNMARLSTGNVFQCGLNGTTQGLLTEKIAELSAIFCVELIARGTPESVASLHSKTQPVDETMARAADESALLPAPKAKENLLNTVLTAQRGETFRTAEAAAVLGVSKRTVSRWVHDCRLKQGPKRGSITATSIQRELKYGKASESSL